MGMQEETALKEWVQEEIPGGLGSPNSLGRSKTSFGYV